MKIFKNITLFLGITLLLAACDKTASHTKLSREEALRIIIAKPKEALRTNQIRFGQMEFSFSPQEAPNVKSVPAKVSATRKLEIERGLITIIPDGRIVGASMGEMIQYYTYYYNVHPTEEGQRYLTKDGIVILGNRVPNAVTGLTSPSSTLDGQTITAKFTYKVVLTPYGKIANTGGVSGSPAVDENKAFKGEAEFVLYDDGWRVEDITFLENEENP